MLFKIATMIKVCVVVVILCHYAKGQKNNISSKLDFDENEYEKNDTTVPILPGVKRGKADGKYNANEGAEDKIEEDASRKSSANAGPKIHGVRVTVDTGDPTKESMESVEITDFGKSKKRVGIRTDITFEITGGDDEGGNKTNSDHDSNEDGGVPVFKGRRHKSGKAHDSKKYPNFSTEHRIYDSLERGAGAYDYYPEYYQQNVPHYSGHVDGQLGGVMSYGNDGWTSYVPRSWTTERPYAYSPNEVSSYGEPRWKPCYCITSGTDHRRRRDSFRYHESDMIIKPTSSLIDIVNGKLQTPFSSE